MPRENRNNDISRFRAALQELENGSEEGVPMLNLTFTLDTPGFADGVYRVRAKGFLAAALWWAAAGKALADWSAFAYIPVAPSGDGVFRFRGRRAVPPEATHILVRAVRPDLQRWEEALFPLPEGWSGSQAAYFRLQSAFPDPQDAFSRLQPVSSDPQPAPPGLLNSREGGLRLCVMSDLHLTKDTGRIRRALGWAAEADGLLLAGDLVNDGLPGQYRLFQQCLEELPGSLPVFAVNGNHDTPQKPLPCISQETDYTAFQAWLERRAARQGLEWRQDESGAYSVRLGPAEIIGLNAAGHWRKFLFPEGRQLRFLEECLQKEEAERGRGWRVILCHAPLLAHNPQRKPGGTPYLNRDRELQRIADGQERVIFISGHTHFSPNVPEGCVEYEPEARRLYLNAGSVRPTEMGTGRPRAAAGDSAYDDVLLPGEWASCVFWELRLNRPAERKRTAAKEDWPGAGQAAAGDLELCARSVHTGRRYPRGYYCFS